jgi:hypothetical protein
MYIAGQIAFDLQFGMGTTFYNDFIKLAGNGLKYPDLMPSALIKKVR